MTLREIRVAHGFSTAFVAKQLGISHRQFNRIEAGQSGITKERLRTLSRLYGVKMSEIAEGVKVSGRTN